MAQAGQRQPPRRTCVACRSTGDKRGLVRLVRTADGDVEVDLTGKKAGRGAYLCPRPGCWETALKRGRVEAALRTKLTPDARLRLSEFATSLAEAVSV
jgi:hypothetical protein